MVGSVSLSTTFGLAIESENDPYIRLSTTGAEGLKQATVPGAFLVDFLPFMKHFPRWCGFMRKARSWHGDMRAMLDIPFEDAKKQWQNRGKVCGVLLYGGISSFLINILSRLRVTKGALLSLLHLKPSMTSILLIHPTSDKRSSSRKSVLLSSWVSEISLRYDDAHIAYMKQALSVQHLELCMSSCLLWFITLRLKNGLKLNSTQSSVVPTEDYVYRPMTTSLCFRTVRPSLKKP